MNVQKNEGENFALILTLSIVATLGGFLFGFDSGVINGTVAGLQEAFDSDSAGTGFNVASMLLGCAVGAFFAGRLADRYGRRSLLIIAALFFILSAWGSGISSSSLEFDFYRIIGGLAVGAASVMSPAYIAEIAPARIRGRLATIQQIAIICGLFTAFVSNYLLAEFAGNSTAILWAGHEAWRCMFWIEIFPAAVFFFGLLAIPESPRYLTASGKIEKAKSVLTRLYGSTSATAKVEEIVQSLAADHHRPRLGDLVDKTTGRIRKIVWVGIGLASFQQFVGINVVFYYGAILWQAVGFSESDALLINVLSGGLSIAACVVTILMIDRIGRKPILMIGSAGMAVTLALVAFAFTQGSLDADGTLQLPDNMGLLALIAANGYVVFFNFSWGPVMWVMLGEMYPNQIRGSGLAVSGFAQWMSNFAITLSFPILLTGVGLAAAYSFYSICAVLSLVFVYKMVHETRGIELEDMRG